MRLLIRPLAAVRAYDEAMTAARWAALQAAESTLAAAGWVQP